MVRDHDHDHDHVDEAAISAIVDSLLGEFGIVEVPASSTSSAPGPDRTEMPRRSWMDQVGRAKRAG